jgi:filamentous hemagglutinin family protein
MKASTILGLALATTALAPLGAHAAGPVLPTGGNVVAGSAVIGSPAGGALAINQSSSKAIIDWNGFSIGQGGAVAFNNGKGATLNRVTGGSISSLDGLLTATGSVYVINPNGVIVGKSGVVNVGGTFVASTLDVSNASFLSGGPLSFMGASNAAVLNYGKIGALGGDVALIAAKVSNAGEIDAANGDAGLLAGYKVVLTDASLDQGRFAVELGGSGTSATNSGLIQAADAELRAEGGNVYALAGDTAGVVRATGVSTGGGHVWLVADGGTLDVAGTLEAQGAGGTAGSIETSGQTVSVGAASIDAHGGTWLVDPDDLTIDVTAATTIDNALNAGTSVTEQTTATGTSGAGTVNTAGNGDIFVISPISWSTNAALTLSAYRNIEVGAAITATGQGALTLITDNSGVGDGGTLVFSGGAIQFTSSAAGQPLGSLTIGVGSGAPVAYTLVDDLATLSADIAANNFGAYALATRVDGSNGGAGYAASPLTPTIATPFGGTLEGLGNTIANLTINDPSSANVGLFAQSAGTIRDVGLVGGSVSGGAQATVGALIGESSGLVQDSSASVAVSGRDAGGLVGYNEAGTISGSYAAGPVTAVPGGAAGGLVAYALGGQITASYATGNVFVTGDPSKEGNLAGGLVAFNGGSITGSYATGTVTGLGGPTTAQGLPIILGGLVGSTNNESSIQDAYASGAVTTSSYGSQIGGLVGEDRGLISDSYAEGAVSGGAAANAGGLVGYGSLDQITNAYALGAVSAGVNADIGGLNGYGENNTITDVYATGMLSGGAGSSIGGLVGHAASPGVTNGYYDQGTTGAGSGFGGVSDVATGAVAIGGATGLSPYSASSYAGLAFGTTPGGSSTEQWVIVDQDGTLNNSTGGVSSLGGTRPFLLSEYTTNIVNAHELQLLNLTPSAALTYQIGADIDATATSASATAPSSQMWSSAGFVPIGGNSAFLSNIYGNNHTINGLYIDSKFNSYVGLFGEFGDIYNGKFIDDVVLYNVSIHGDGRVGGLVGYLYGGLISSVSVSGVVSGGDGAFVGGLIGFGNYGFLDFSHSSATVQGGDGAVVGGIIGSSELSAESLFSYATGNVSGGQNASVGGFAGQIYTGVFATYATGDVTGGANAHIGGFAGEVDDGAYIVSSYASGAVTGSKGAIAGGLVGELNDSSVATAYAIGAVTVGGSNGPGALGEAGGLVGYNNGGTISTAYATGKVSGGGDGLNTLGGLVGVNTGGSVSEAFWDVQTTGQLLDAAVSPTGDATEGSLGLTTAQFMDATGPIAGLGLGAAPGGSGFVIVDDDGTLNGANGATRPFLLTEYSNTISNAHQLQLMALDPAANYTLAGDIDATGTGASAASSSSNMWSSAGFAPIGNPTSEFTGTFTGSGDTVLGLTINRPTTAYVGLFGIIGPTSTVEDVSLSGTTISGDSAGALAGGSFGTIANVNVSAAVTGGAAGGLVGNLLSGMIVNSTSSGSVIGAQSMSSYAGGLVAINSGAISGSSSSSVVNNASALAGSEGATPDAGGLVGFNGGSIIDAHASGSVVGSHFGATGGLVGENQGTITLASYTNTDSGVQGAADVGGAAGLNDAGATLTNVSVTASVSSASYTGGIVGDNFGAVAGSTFNGAVSGGGGVGGAVGVNEGGASVTGGSVGMTVSTAVTGTANDVGGLAGANFGTVGASGGIVPFAGVVTGVDHVGGVAGYNAGVINAVASGDGNSIASTATVNGRDYVGGQIGLNYGTLTTYQAAVSVSGDNYVGGVAGWNDSDGVLTTNISDGVPIATVIATGDYVGGFAGVNKGAIAAGIGSRPAVIMGSVSGSGYVGGVAGLNQGSITGASSLIPVFGNLYVGGLVGWNDTGATVNTSYATGTVTGAAGGQDASGNDYVGGLVGVNFGSIANSYATGAVSGVQVVGGLVGTNMPGGASVASSYATGAVSASAGAVGTTFGVQAGEATYVYGFPSLSGQPTESGYVNAGARGDGTDLTTMQEDGSAAYAGFDFTNTWQSNPSGAPTLQAPPAP